MIAVRLPELKHFTSQLFVQDTFHSFLIYEASFVTGCNYVIDGRRNREYYSPEEAAPTEEYVSWAELRPVCFQIIRGTRLPLQFKLVLRAPQTLLTELLQNADTAVMADQIEALHFIIHYRDGGITCTTGVSLKLFTLDKSLDKLWDRYILQFLEQQGIEYEYL